MEATVPAATAAAALALLLGFASTGTILAGLAAATLAGLASNALTPASVGESHAILACWAIVVLLAVVVWWPGRIANHGFVSAAMLTGLVMGAALRTTANPTVLVALIPILLTFPTALAVRRGHAIAPRIVAGWLVAVAILGATLPNMIAHPGYVADHRG
jgi:hypothetical protein